MTVCQAKKLGIENFSLLVCHVLVPPAIEAIMTSPVPGAGVPRGRARVHGDGDGGVPADLAERFQVPIVVTGFEPLDMLEGIRRTVQQLEEGRAEVENAYARAVAADGNPSRSRCSRTSSRSCDRAWRGIGMIPQSGWRLSERYREYDAEHRFSVGDIHTQESSICRCGEVLQGLIKPHECAAFGKECTPRNPLGATMVSSEGACAAYYLYRRMQLPVVEQRGRWLPLVDRSRAGSVRCRCGTARRS